MRTHPIVEYYQALRDSAPCLSRAATLPKGPKLGLGKRRAPGNTIILSQPYRRRVSTDRLNREGSQLAASLEGEPGPTPAGKTLPHSFPETSRFRRERARDVPGSHITPVFMVLMGKNLVDEEMLCLGMVSTNLFRLFYAGEIQNLNCRRLEMATSSGIYIFLHVGEICKRRQSCCSTVPRTVKQRHQRMWFCRRSRIVGG